MSGDECAIIAGVGVLLFARRALCLCVCVPPHWLIFWPPRRRAMRLAAAALRDLHGREPDALRSEVLRRNSESYYVRVLHAGSRQLLDASCWQVFVVWKRTWHVDDLGTWGSPWGKKWREKVAPYERCIADGRTWATERPSDASTDGD